MKTTPINDEELKKLWQENWSYIKTIVDISTEPALILDKKLSVITATKPFYEIFGLIKKETVGKTLSTVGDGQWNIVTLLTLLKEIQIKETTLKAFPVSAFFPLRGNKNMLLNARMIHNHKKVAHSSLVLIIIEDITEVMKVADQVAKQLLKRQ